MQPLAMLVDFVRARSEMKKEKKKHRAPNQLTFCAAVCVDQRCTRPSVRPSEMLAGGNAMSVLFSVCVCVHFGWTGGRNGCKSDVWRTFLRSLIQSCARVRVV